MENPHPKFTTLMLTESDKSLVGALLKEMSVSQQFALSTIFKEAEARAKGMLAEVDPKVPEATKEA